MPFGGAVGIDDFADFCGDSAGSYDVAARKGESDVEGGEVGEELGGRGGIDGSSRRRARRRRGLGYHWPPMMKSRLWGRCARQREGTDRGRRGGR